MNTCYKIMTSSNVNLGVRVRDTL